jgi:hypothetical protein
MSPFSASSQRRSPQSLLSVAPLSVAPTLVSPLFLLLSLLCSPRSRAAPTQHANVSQRAPLAIRGSIGGSNWSLQSLFPPRRSRPRSRSPRSLVPCRPEPPRLGILSSRSLLSATMTLTPPLLSLLSFRLSPAAPGRTDSACGRRCGGRSRT